MAKTKQFWFLVEEEFERKVKDVVRDINYHERPDKLVTVAGYIRGLVEQDVERREQEKEIRV